MSAILQRMLWSWGSGLMLLLCLVWLPLARAGQWVGVVIILLFTLAGLFYTERSRKREYLDSLSAVLPPDSDRRPVVLVCSHVQDSLFGEELLRQTPQGYWLRLPPGTSLSDGVANLLAARPAWGGQLSVMAVINPQQYRDEMALAGWVRELRWQLAQVRRRQGIPLPLVLIGYLAGVIQRPDSPWFAWQAGQNTVTVWRKGVSGQPLADWLGEGSVTEQTARFQCGVELTGWADWMKACVLLACLTPENGLPPCPPQAMALTFVPALPQRLTGHLWQQWLQTKTALNSAGDPVSSPDTGTPVLPFPDHILRLLPMSKVQIPVQRALGRALGLFLLAGMIALGCSAWHNRQLLRQVEDDLLNDQSIAITDESGKAQAMTVLKHDAARLEEYDHDGVPWRLGLGLYQGARLRPRLQAAIAGYHPEHREKTPVTPSVPQTISLNSLALFDVGQAKLKAGSTKVLVNALINIRAKPGWMILITGHTDSTGDAAKNQALSLARAEAVRDWLLQNSDTSLACFAVQGEGATQPIAANTTAAGRAANRRVEIHLIPHAVACQRPQHVSVF
ncbi:OmpA family protein [Photorhabdus thracensis]|uniref:OmpA family protein n=1 Tax=Photorhabdus thracensis TaxID=230089 RepID=UPI001E32586F|nr:OmpA family protein [Photorhabdus thracensis]MCC8422630.1 OmpA family protein [Photorhabdus thracensis]